MSVWIARDKDGVLYVYENKPLLEKSGCWAPDYDEMNETYCDCFQIDPENYKEVIFGNSPMKMISAAKVVELVKKEKQKQLESIIERVRDLCNIRQVLEYLKSIE